jgi:hypothetical protein
MLLLAAIGVHAGGGADTQLNDGAALVEFFWSDAEFLAEELANLSCEERIIYADRAGLRTAPA